MPIEQRTLTINGNHYACLIAGNPQNPPILMIHGWAHHPSIWASTLERYQADYFCVAVGVLGLGDSDKPSDGDYRIQAHARDTLAIADALHIDRFILMGHSRGGQIALCLTSQIAPERVIKLVNVSGVVTGRLTPYMRWIMRPSMWMNARLSLWNQAGRQVFRHYVPSAVFYSPYFANVRSVPREIIINDILGALSPDARHSTYRCMQTMTATDLTADLHAITVPTLILFGAQDGCVPVIEGWTAHQHIAGSTFVILKDCGHYPMVESPNAYFEVLRAFIAQ